MPESAPDKCSQCGGPMPPLPPGKPPTRDDAEPICPVCAANYIKSKSQRRKVITTLMDLYGVPQDSKEAIQEALKKKEPPPEKPAK